MIKCWWIIRGENHDSMGNQRKELQFCEELSTLRITILWRIVNVKNYNSVENCQRKELQFCGELSAKTIISGEIIIIRSWSEFL